MACSDTVSDRDAARVPVNAATGPEKASRREHLDAAHFVLACRSKCVYCRAMDCACKDVFFVS